MKYYNKNHSKTLLSFRVSNFFKLITIFLSLASSPSAFAELKLTKALILDVSKAYGFYIGQNHSLSEIPKKYPALNGLAFIAEKEFEAGFIASIKHMDDYMNLRARKEWSHLKQSVKNQIESTFDVTQLSEYQARQFLELVRKRAKGNIESPILETFLLFKPDYGRKPEQEFLDGYRYKYSTDGNGKAKGVSFSIEVPKTWKAKEASRPNIVQKFVSENGRGLSMFMVMVLDNPLEYGEIVSQKDVESLLKSDEIYQFIPENSKLLDSGKLTLETLPGYWMNIESEIGRVRNSVKLEMLQYNVFYKDKFISFQGQVPRSINGALVDNGGLEKYEKLFDIMVNSFVLPDLYH